jgi:hypothetical protein
MTIHWHLAAQTLIKPQPCPRISKSLLDQRPHRRVWPGGFLLDLAPLIFRKDQTQPQQKQTMAERGTQSAGVRYRGRSQEDHDISSELGANSSKKLTSESRRLQNRKAQRAYRKSFVRDNSNQDLILIENLQVIEREIGWSCSRNLWPLLRSRLSWHHWINNRLQQNHSLKDPFPQS